MKYEAFKVIPVVERVAHKIECVSAWDQNKLLVGTSDGTLLVFDISDNIDNGDPAVITKAHKNFCKRAITQLTASDDLDLLITLSDGVISTYDLPSCKHRTTLRSRGFSLYRVDLQQQHLPLVAATKKKIVVFHWDGGDFVEIRDFPLIDTPKTMEWAGTSVCIGYKRLYTLIDTHTGRTTELFPTGKAGAPQAKALPSSELLLTKDNVGIFIGFDGKPTRKFGLNWSDTPVKLAHSFPYVIAILPKFIEIRMMLTETLVQTVNASFLETTSNKKDIFVASHGAIYRLHPVPVLRQVAELVERSEYSEAITLCQSVTQDATEKDKEQREAKLIEIHLAYAFDLVGHKDYEAAFDNFEQAQCDPRIVLSLFPDLLPRNIKEKYETENPELALIPTFTAEDLPAATAALISYLKGVRVSDTYSDAEPGDEAGRRAFSSVCASSAPGDVRQVIDTCLLKAYLIQNSSEYLNQFLLSPNQCHTEESERALKQYHKTAELVLFHRSRGHHRAALELLRTLAQPGNKDATHAALQGLEPSIQYMQALPVEDIDLVLEYSLWLFDTDPTAALRIFTAEPRPPAKFPPRTVLAHLKKAAPLHCAPYLEHIVYKHKDDSPDLHDELILLYLDQTTALLRESAYHTDDITSDPSVPLPRAGTEPGLLGEYRSKLITFLQESTKYHPEKMLSRFPYNELYEERALLLSRIGQHDQALTIYALKLNDPIMAEDYCKRYYDPESPETKDVYLSLLEAYLRPPDDTPPRLAPALDILNRHFGSIDAARALHLIPTNTPLKDLAPFCEAYFQNDMTGRRNAQVVKNLLKSENLIVHEQLLRGRSRVVRITADRMCQACHKRIGNSVFACYPNGQVVHFVCCKDKTIDPVTGTDFSKNTYETIDKE